MSSFQFPSFSQANETGAAAARFFNAVYAWMSAGLAMTALVAWYVSQHFEMMSTIGIGGVIVIGIVQIMLVGMISSSVQRISAVVATLLFLLYAASVGFVLSWLFVFYTKGSLASVFVVTAGMFGGASIFGMVTKKDLSAASGLFFMLLVGLGLATLVNIFVPSSGLAMIISYVGVFTFVGLTAYDTQRLRVWAIETSHDPALAARLSVNGALSLYLDFINLFMFLVRVLGVRRNDD